MPLSSKKNLVLFLFTFFIPVFPMNHGTAAPPAEALGKACVVVEETGMNGEIVKQVPLTKNSIPGENTRLTFYAESSRDGYLLAAAFSRKGGLAHDWRPQMVPLSSRTEIHLPEISQAWSWNNPESFDLYLVFLPSEGISADWQTLANAMQNPKADPKLLALQTIRLKETIQKQFPAQDLSTAEPARIPDAWGGTLRGNGFPWKQLAQKTRFAENETGLLIYRYGD